MISGFVIAMYVGPSGLAVIGQLQNFITTFSNGAITSQIHSRIPNYRAKAKDI